MEGGWGGAREGVAAVAVAGICQEERSRDASCHPVGLQPYAYTPTQLASCRCLQGLKAVVKRGRL